MAKPHGDRTRLRAELDHLQRLGVTNVRILAGFEGPESEPNRTAPALMIAPGEYNPAVVDGLDYLLFQLGKRGMTAVVALINFWEWSGGMAQYVSWHEHSEIPYPQTHDWRVFCDYATRFYACDTCQEWFRDHISAIIGRVNPYTHRRYRDEPAVFAWELANEPRYYPQSWIVDTARFIKSLDPNHLVTTGSEGEVGGDFDTTHRSEDIDYATLHIWPQNWGWFDPQRPETYDHAERTAMAYLRRHVEQARSLGKPLVLEEFGLARDRDADHDIYSSAAGITHRDRFFTAMLNEVAGSSASGGPLAGSNIWVWSGRARPQGPWIGDPPHEPPGWYSVFDTDTSTLAVLKRHGDALAEIAKRRR